MKKLLLILVLFLSVNSLFAQKISNLSPTLVVWEMANKKYSLKDAKYGVQQTDSLSLNVYFHKSFFDRVKTADNITFEYRWYYYLSTRRSLMFVDKVKYNQGQTLDDNVISFSSSQKTLQPGWWEVQIITTYDNGYIQIGDTYKYQIFIKK